MQENNGGDTEIVNFWNEVLVPKFIKYKHILVDGLTHHSEAIFPTLQVKEGDSVLDVGCGFGDTAVKLARIVGPAGRVVGLDCCDAFMDYGRQAADDEGLANVTFVNGDALVVRSVEEVSSIDPHKKVLLFSQTTMDPERFKEVERALEDHLKKNAGEKAYVHFRSDCTICGQMKKRKPGLSSFAHKYDVMLFVSGKNSSNGKMLYEYCLSLNPVTYWISGQEDVEKQWFDGCESIGISGATSTSRVQLESVMEQVKKLTAS